MSNHPGTLVRNLVALVFCPSQLMLLSPSASKIKFVLLHLIDWISVDRFDPRWLPRGWRRGRFESCSTSSSSSTMRGEPPSGTLTQNASMVSGLKLEFDVYDVSILSVLINGLLVANNHNCIWCLFSPKLHNIFVEENQHCFTARGIWIRSHSWRVEREQKAQRESNPQPQEFSSVGVGIFCSQL